MLARTSYRACSFLFKVSKEKIDVGQHHDLVLVCSCKSLHTATDYTTRPTPATTPFSVSFSMLTTPKTNFLKKSVLSKFIPSETCFNKRLYYCKPGDWTCTGVPGEPCKGNNHSGTESCIHCGKDKPEGATFLGGRFKKVKIDKRGTKAKVTQPDWTCPDLSCGTSNSALRNRCSKCFKYNPDKPEFTVRIPQLNKKGEIVNRDAGEKRNKRDERDKRNEQGNARREDRKNRGYQYNHEEGRISESMEREARPGDWTCPKWECGVNNWPHRMNCHACLTRRPLETMSKDYEQNQRHRSEGFERNS